MRYLYLHGFASSPQSRKARAFTSAFASLDLRLEVPALDGGDFAHLTVGRQLRLLAEQLGGEPARLIGSSLGGYLAALYASTHPEVDRLVLLAPAFHFADLWTQAAGPAQMARWRETGALDVFHYGTGTPRPISYELYSESLCWPPAPAFPQPAMIFHGKDDSTVPISLSRTFSVAHPNATLTELDSDHELLNVLDTIVSVAVPFLVP